MDLVRTWMIAHCYVTARIDEGCIVYRYAYIEVICASSFDPISINIEVERFMYNNNLPAWASVLPDKPKPGGYPLFDARLTPYNHWLSIQSTLSNAGINVCANQKLKTNFGPVISNLGVRPLKKEVNPSFRAMLLRILNPLSGLSKFRFCIRVLITSSGADTTSEADAPATEATKFCSQLALE